ncbi:MAG TPA: transcription antitermination factor NusB [Thermoanaerobaculia bacterium]|nr:transcription antitermination factor NusB [Thermoanaerobaculia bacterium]
MNDRQRALTLLRRIERDELFASLVLHDETGFVRTLVLGVLRWRSRLDWTVTQFAQREIEPEIADVLRIGAYQILFMDVAKYAAVSETVTLAPHRARGFVNAILRRVAKEKPEPEDLATRTAHPEWLIERWIEHYGAERAAAIADANQELSQPDVLSLRGGVPPDATPSTLVDGIFKVEGSTAQLDRDEFWPMDEGSAIIAAMARACGDDILDLAAAPGGKTMYMTSRGARVVSNDISITRLRPLRHAKVVSDGRKPPFARQFDVVLLDAPCSATGTIRKNPELKWRLRDVTTHVPLQKELLASAMQLARHAVVYSTCSLEPEENDEVVADYDRDDAAKFVPHGAVRWVENGVLRLTPESGADGFTAFVLRKR